MKLYDFHYIGDYKYKSYFKIKYTFNFIYLHWGFIRPFCCSFIAKMCLTLVWPRGLLPSRLLCPWDFPGRNTGVGCCFLLQGIFSTQGSNLCLLYCRRILYQLSRLGSLYKAFQHMNYKRIPLNYENFPCSSLTPVSEEQGKFTR